MAETIAKIIGGIIAVIIMGGMVTVIIAVIIWLAKATLDRDFKWFE